MRRARAGLWVVALSAITVVFPGVSQGSVHGCSPLLVHNQPVNALSVRNMSCAEAARAIDRGRAVTRTAFATSGWRCTTLGSTPEDTTVRCVRSSKAFRFTAGG